MYAHISLMVYSVQVLECFLFQCTTVTQLLFNSALWTNFPILFLFYQLLFLGIPTIKWSSHFWLCEVKNLWWWSKKPLTWVRYGTLSSFILNAILYLIKSTFSSRWSFHAKSMYSLGALNMNNNCRYLVQGKTTDSEQLEEVSKFLQLVSFTHYTLLLC